MQDLIFKENLSKEEAEELDDYLTNNIDEILKLDNEIIIKVINNINETIGFSFFKHDLFFDLDMRAVDAKICFDESMLEEYLKQYQLMKALEFDCSRFSLAFGDYYFNKDKEKSLKYYSEVFKEGFDISENNYYYQLERYLDLLDTKPSEILEKLIKASPKKKDFYSLDQIDTYLTLIVNLEKDDPRYIKYIDEALIPAKKLVREHQKYQKNRYAFSDTDEERDFCELITLKFEYFVLKKDYKKAFKLYKLLTDEIGRSDCTRYYHARDRFYKQMLEYMSENYPELAFFKDTAYKKYEILENVNDINEYLGEEITLKNEENQIFKFKIIRIYENWVTLAPILPLLGEGGHMHMNFIKENNKSYLQNRLAV